MQIPEPSDFPDAAGVNEKINAVETTLSGIAFELRLLTDRFNRLVPDLTAINQEIATLKAKLSALENLSPPNTSGIAFELRLLTDRFNRLVKVLTGEK